MSKRHNATRTAAPVKAEKTRSRTEQGEQPRSFQIDRLGKVITWHLPNAPYAGDANLRPAFIGGFELRCQNVNQGKEDDGVAIRFVEGSKEQQAFEDGYNEAARQDGLHLKAKTLDGSSSKAKKAK